jgi:hypothetical protein
MMRHVRPGSADLSGSSHAPRLEKLYHVRERALPALAEGTARAVSGACWLARR